jgi:SAM-dependent methyltransferase
MHLPSMPSDLAANDVFPAGDVASKSYDNSGNQPLLELVPSSANRILDIGCGRGSNARVLSRRGAVVDGITLSEDEAVAAREFCRSVIVHDLEMGLPDSLQPPYDVLLCSHVLEHLRWPNRLLEDLRRISVPGHSLLLVALPNLLFYKNRAAIAAGYFEYADSGIMDASHFRWFTFATSRRLLESAGFSVEICRGEGSFPLPILRRVLPKPVTQAIDATAVHAIPGLFSHQFLLAARPR